MSVEVKALKKWLATLNNNDYVGIDDGGMILVSESDPVAYYEVGGLIDENKE